MFFGTPFLLHGGDDGAVTVRYRFAGDATATSETWWSNEESDSTVFMRGEAFATGLARSTGTLYMSFVSHYDYVSDTATFDVTGAVQVARALDCFP